jgi:hypothetical protein
MAEPHDTTYADLREEEGGEKPKPDIGGAEGCGVGDGGVVGGIQPAEMDLHLRL